MNGAAVRYYYSPALDGVLARLEGMVAGLKLEAQFNGLTPAKQTACCVLIRLVTMGRGRCLWFDETWVQFAHLGFGPDEIKAGWTEAGELLREAQSGPPQRLPSLL